MMKRREVITLLAGAVAWPLAARAQQGERVRRIGVVVNLAAEDPESKARIGAFLQRLSELGWTSGRNVRIDFRWSATDDNGIRRSAEEIVALAPDVILANGSAIIGRLLQATRSAPIVFTNVSDPVGAGFVDNLARPGGNATGFALFEFGTSAKWLELLKQIAPTVRRAGVVRDAANPTGLGQFAAMQSMAASLGVELSPIGLREAGDMEHAIQAFAQASDAGLVITSSPSAAMHRDLIINLAARHRLPTVYPFRYWVASGGLASYGADTVEPFRQAAGYVDRILKGEKPADLPVQAPTKYELVINLKTARALGLTIPTSILVRADEVIE
jgi:putative tryptophan/tyrosine transport system substrate-binding protein